MFNSLLYFSAILYTFSSFFRTEHATLLVEHLALHFLSTKTENSNSVLYEPYVNECLANKSTSNIWNLCIKASSGKLVTLARHCLENLHLFKQLQEHQKYTSQN